MKEWSYIQSPINGRLICKYDKTFYLEYLPDTHVFVKNKFGCTHYSGFCRQIWLNIDLIKKFGTWLEPYIIGHERAHILYYNGMHQAIQAKRDEAYYDHEIFMENKAIEYVKYYYEDDIYNKCLNFYINRVDELKQKRDQYANRN